MNKIDLINDVINKTGLTKKDVGNALNCILDTISSELTKGNNIKINNIGTFDVKVRSERQGRNPQTGENISIPEQNYPTFKPSKVLKRVVNGVSVIDIIKENHKLNDEEVDRQHKTRPFR
ncbi:HU family DNA-binding protein [Salimicrobium flavidum]|uniref:DNA-binding protein HU-beta n=1 Tax=Salimicrobium flavidum TaxID=570947 RepID=A0A1N7KNW9_9BACI|nr:HU family DNA-binding protein [Salimicrobium flavidum]SIS63231.1 DNA-binding protein HU-beta [Salimicrobium flavidum]